LKVLALQVGSTICGASLTVHYLVG